MALQKADAASPGLQSVLSQRQRWNFNKHRKNILKVLLFHFSKALESRVKCIDGFWLLLPFSAETTENLLFRKPTTTTILITLKANIRETWSNVSHYSACFIGCNYHRHLKRCAAIKPSHITRALLSHSMERYPCWDTVETITLLCLFSTLATFRMSRAGE